MGGAAVVWLDNLALADVLLSGVGKMLIAPLRLWDSVPFNVSWDGGYLAARTIFLSSPFGARSLFAVVRLSHFLHECSTTRRDALLFKSKVPPPVRSSFRLLPLSNSLIGPQVTDMVHQASERARDAASLRSQQAPASGSQGPFSARGGGSGSGGLAGEVVGPLSVSGPGT